MGVFDIFFKNFINYNSFYKLGYILFLIMLVMNEII